MQQFAATCEAIVGTASKLAKIALVADFLRTQTIDEATVAAVFLSGRPFPAWEDTNLQVGGRSLWRIVSDLAGKDEAELVAAYRRLGDLGSVANEVLPGRSSQGINIEDAARTFRDIAAARGMLPKSAIVRDLLARATPIEAKYLIKIMTGDLRIGLKESLVEEAIAKAFGSALAEVQRANLLLGDIGETLRLSANGRLHEAHLRLFHPLGFMLASPVDSPEEGLSYFSDAAVEDKYDGIRAQAHVSGAKVKIFSRTRDDITESFPELPPALSGLSFDAVLDGEIVAWEYPAHLQAAPSTVGKAASEAGEENAANLGRARPFSVLQQRLGRKKVSDKMLRKTPVAFLVFDILYAGGQLTIDSPWQERAQRLNEILAADRVIRHAGTESEKAEQVKLAFAEEPPIRSARVIRAPVFQAKSAAELETLFALARARGNEGLMIKDVNSPYTPGRRGKSWLKMKRELATLDVVVTAVEYGHGKRIGVLSDYTFAVWDRDRLVNIGKAYSGLTDAEISEMTQWFLDHTIEDRGFLRVVEPKIVLEVAFNNMMLSQRHESGYALRFPRIMRIRKDKSAEDADRLSRAHEIYQRQE